MKLILWIAQDLHKTMNKGMVKKQKKVPGIKNK